MDTRLLRIEASKQFRESAQLRRLLVFLADKAAAGEVASQYDIAIEVFGRNQRFDPTTDPIVRVEMRRLRKRLDLYYLENADDPWHIEIPERSYAATFTPASSHRAAPRLAVLPFAHDAGDSEAATLAEGIADDIIYVLRPDAGLTVLPRSSVFRLHSQGMGAAEIADEVSAEWILDGSVARSGKQWEINTALRRAPQMDRALQRSWTAGPADIPAVASQIGATARLLIVPTSSATPQPSVIRLPSAAAHMSYMQGMQLFNLRRVDVTRQAVDLFEKSIAEDGGFVRPRIALLETIYSRGLGGLEISGDEPRARQLLRECEELEPNSADVLTGTAVIRLAFENNHAEALALMLRAVQLEPHNLMPHRYLCAGLALADREEEAISLTSRALRLDPMSGVWLIRLAIVATICGRPQEAIELLDEAISLSPELAVPAYSQQAMELTSVGAHAEALSKIEKAESMSGPVVQTLAVKGHILGRTGNDGAASAIAQQLEARCRSGLISPMLPALVHCGRNDQPRAAEFVRLAVERRSFIMTVFLRFGIMAPLREWEGGRDLLMHAKIPLPPLSRSKAA